MRLNPAEAKKVEMTKTNRKKSAFEIKCELSRKKTLRVSTQSYSFDILKQVQKSRTSK